MSVSYKTGLLPTGHPGPMGGMNVNTQRVEEITQVSKAQRWPYPYIFAALRDAGVAGYSVDVATRTTVYRGVDGSIWNEPCPAGWRRVETGVVSFDAAAVAQALRRHADEHTAYADFLVDIAAAGVTEYNVDMRSGTCAYRSGRPGEEHVESIPEPGPDPAATVS